MIPFPAGSGSESKVKTSIARKRGQGDVVQDSAAYKTAGSTQGQRGKLPKTLGRNLPGQVSLLAVVLGVLALAGPVAAGNLTITPSLELRETFSDNIDLEPDGQDQSALTTEIVPGITLRSESARVTAALNAFPIIRHQTAGSDKGVSIAGDLAALVNGIRPRFG